MCPSSYAASKIFETWLQKTSGLPRRPPPARRSSAPRPRRPRPLRRRTPRRAPRVRAEGCFCAQRENCSRFSVVSSLRRGHANLLSIVPLLTDDPRREPSKRLFVPRCATSHLYRARYNTRDTQYMEAQYSCIFQRMFTFQWYVPKDCHLSSGFLLELTNVFSSVACSNDISLV